MKIYLVSFPGDNGLLNKIAQMKSDILLSYFFLEEDKSPTNLRKVIRRMERAKRRRNT